MNRHYQLRFSTQPSASAWMAFGSTCLTAEALLAKLGSAGIRTVISTNGLGADGDLLLRAQSREDAVLALEAALEDLGFGVARVVGTDLLAAALQRALFGALGGGAAGATTKNWWWTAAGTAVGGIAGFAMDSAVNEAWALFHAERDEFSGQWRIVDAPRPQWGTATA